MHQGGWNTQSLANVLNSVGSGEPSRSESKELCFNGVNVRQDIRALIRKNDLKASLFTFLFKLTL